MKIVQFDDGLRPVYKKCLDQVAANLPAGVTRDLITHNAIDVRNRDYRAPSEVVRLVEAASVPDMMWLDSDVLIKKWPTDFKFKPGRPYMSEKWVEAIFYVNGCCDFFRGLLREYEDEPRWLRKIFLDHKSEFELIPEGYFVHLALSQAVLAGKNFSNYGNQDYQVYKNDNGELQIDIRL